MRDIRRRELVTLLGGTAAAAWPIATHAQDTSKLPTIGFLGASTPSTASYWVTAFMQRLRELGWTEGRNVTIEFRWAEAALTASSRSRPSSSR
jgi:putative ABC transport system substrate-binding protein